MSYTRRSWILAGSNTGAPHTGTTPVHTGTTPVHTGTTPVHTGTTPVHTGTTPVHTGTTPTPVHTGTIPVHTERINASSGHRSYVYTAGNRAGTGQNSAYPNTGRLSDRRHRSFAVGEENSHPLSNYGRQRASVAPDYVVPAEVDDDAAVVLPSTAAACIASNTVCTICHDDTAGVGHSGAVAHDAAFTTSTTYEHRGTDTGATTATGTATGTGTASGTASGVGRVRRRKAPRHSTSGAQRTSGNAAGARASQSARVMTIEGYGPQESEVLHHVGLHSTALRLFPNNNTVHTTGNGLYTHGTDDLMHTNDSLYGNNTTGTDNNRRTSRSWLFGLSTGSAVSQGAASSGFGGGGGYLGTSDLHTEETLMSLSAATIGQLISARSPLWSAEDPSLADLASRVQHNSRQGQPHATELSEANGTVCRYRFIGSSAAQVSERCGSRVRPNSFVPLHVLVEASVPPDMRCGICLDMFEQPAYTPCGHVFCLDCALRSLTRQLTCPMCRSALYLENVKPLRKAQTPSLVALHNACQNSVVQCPRCWWLLLLAEGNKHRGSQRCRANRKRRKENEKHYLAKMHTVDDGTDIVADVDLSSEEADHIPKFHSPREETSLVEWACKNEKGHCLRLFVVSQKLQNTFGVYTSYVLGSGVCHQEAIIEFSLPPTETTAEDGQVGKTVYLSMEIFADAPGIQWTVHSQYPPYKALSDNVDVYDPFPLSGYGLRDFFTEVADRSYNVISWNCIDFVDALRAAAGIEHIIPTHSRIPSPVSGSMELLRILRSIQTRGALPSVHQQQTDDEAPQQQQQFDEQVMEEDNDHDEEFSECYDSEQGMVRGEGGCSVAVTQGSAHGQQWSGVHSNGLLSPQRTIATGVEQAHLHDDDCYYDASRQAPPPLESPLNSAAHVVVTQLQDATAVQRPLESPLNSAAHVVVTQQDATAVQRRLRYRAAKQRHQDSSTSSSVILSNSNPAAATNTDHPIAIPPSTTSITTSVDSTGSTTAATADSNGHSGACGQAGGTNYTYHTSDVYSCTGLVCTDTPCSVVIVHRIWILLADAEDLHRKSHRSSHDLIASTARFLFGTENSVSRLVSVDQSALTYPKSYIDLKYNTYPIALFEFKGLVDGHRRQRVGYLSLEFRSDSGLQWHIFAKPPRSLKTFGRNNRVASTRTNFSVQNLVTVIDKYSSKHYDNTSWGGWEYIIALLKFCCPKDGDVLIKKLITANSQ